MLGLTMQWVCCSEERSHETVVRRIASWISAAHYNWNLPFWAAREASPKADAVSALHAFIPGLGLCRFARVGDS